jgi:hypothetical protein
MKRVSTHDQKMDARDLDPDVDPPNLVWRYMKQFHQSHSAFLLVQLTIPKFNLEMTGIILGLVCENPALVLFRSHSEPRPS